MRLHINDLAAIELALEICAKESTHKNHLQHIISRLRDELSNEDVQLIKLCLEVIRDQADTEVQRKSFQGIIDRLRHQDQSN